MRSTEAPPAVTIIAPARWLKANDRTDRRTASPVVKAWRHAAKIDTLQAKLPTMRRVTVEFCFTQKCKPHQLLDPDGFAPTAKAILDGIVDARVLPDDGGFYVRSVTLCAPEVGPKDAVTVVLYEAAS